VLRVYIAIAVLGMVAILARRFVKKTGGVSGLAVTSRATLARGAAVAVVEVDRRRFLVSITGSATTLLAELDHLPVIVEEAPDASVVAPGKPVASAVPSTTMADSFLARARRATARSLKSTGR
jgi:flagellar biogenesis protein FliO